jgi:hypothetical protein
VSQGALVAALDLQVRYFDHIEPKLQAFCETQLNGDALSVKNFLSRASSDRRKFHSPQLAHN